jgi:hypothetical protein
MLDGDWSSDVCSSDLARIAEVVNLLRPQALFMPHEGDWNATHVGVHHLGMDALAALPKDFACAVCTTEYWHPHATPNAMIGLSEKTVADLLAALACHAGEVARNPYDRRLTAYLSDNIRRGSERLCGKGAAAVAMDFAMLYRVGQWRGGKLSYSALTRITAAEESIGIFD